MKLYEILYVSTIAPGTPVTAISDIMAKARRANQVNGLTGLLVFDGQRFAQLLEGDYENVLQKIERIRSDGRHVNMEILHHGRLAERRFKRFSMGYVPTEQENAIGLLEHTDGMPALQNFLALIPALDLDA